MANYAPVQETLAAPAGPPIDPDVLEQRRKLAQALIAQAMGGEPIGSWTQGVAKLAQALMGGYNVRKTNQQEAAGRASGAADTAAALAELAAAGGGGGYSGGDSGTAEEPGTEPVSSAPTSDVEAYIRQSASKRGIDPNVAVRVARSEGLAPGVWQSNFRNNGRRETSYGPYQLLVGGGLGDKFIRQTGLNPRDPSTVKAQVDFALDQARQGGWSPWYGAAKVGVGNWTGINRGGGGETAGLPNVEPVSDAPSPDVAAFLGSGTQARPRVVYPPAAQSPAPMPNVGMGELTGSGTRAGPDYVPAPAPIGRGATAAPVAETPMPTRPTVTGYPAIAAALQPPPPNYDPATMPRPISPPDAMGRTTPGATGPVAMPQPIPQGGHVLMAQQPPAPLPEADQGLALLDPSAIPSSIDAPAALAPVAVPPQSPRDRAVQAVVQAQGRPDAPILASADVPALPRARPAAPLPSMPPGQQTVAPAQPPEHPLARAPQPRPAPPAPPAAAPATTASIPQPQPRRQIFREPGAPLSAQEFARQGQNYLTGRGSFANQTPRVAPRTMQEPIAGASAGAPAVPVAATAPAQPRRGLLAALLGRGGPQAPAAAQPAPAGFPVAAGATAAAPADSSLARLMVNPYVDPAIKAAVFARAFPKDKPYVNVPAGGTVYDPNTNKPLFTSPAKPEKPPSAVQEYEYAKSQGFKGSFEEWELQQKRAGAQPIIVGAGEKSYTVERGKLLAKQFGDIQDAGLQAQGKLGSLDAMEQALGKTGYTGWGAPQLLETKRAAKLLGIDTGDLGAAETAQAISNQLAMQLRNPSGGAGMPGAMSDADRNFLKASVLGIERTPEGNARLLDYNRRLEQRSIDVAQQASNYAAAHGGMLDDGFGSELAKWAKANPLFPEARDTPVPSKSGTTSGGVKWSVEP